jgi:hypothetical protein
MVLVVIFSINISPLRGWISGEACLIENVIKKGLETANNSDSSRPSLAKRNEDAFNQRLQRQ